MSARTPHTLRRASVVLIAVVTLITLAVEVGTRLFIHRLSASLGRIQAEQNAAADLRQGQGQRQLLIVGNSLLMADVDIAALNRALEPQWHVTRFAIEQTTYYDWYFGLRRLLTAGSQPEAIVMCLEPRHLIAPGVRNEIFARFLLQPRDIYRVSRTLDMTPTETSDLFFANTSAFYALRKEIRKNLLGRLMPSLPNLTALITRGGLPPPDPQQLSTVGKERLANTKDMAAAANSRLVLALTPPLRPADAQILKTIGDDLRIPVLAPLPDDAIDGGDFDRDGYHLSAAGRTRYTELLIPALVKALNGDESARNVAEDK